MRIDRGGVGVDEGLEYVFAIELIGLTYEALIALLQRAADISILFAGQFQR